MKDEQVDRCSNGHEWTPANTRWESSGRGKHRRRRCRQCLRDKAARRVVDYDYATANAIPDRIRFAHPAKSRAVLKEFEAAQQHVKANCGGTGKGNPWTDGWEDEDGELQPHLIPSPEFAQKLCAGCPLLDICGKSGRITLPEIGIWGGDVWIRGEIYTGGTRTE